MIFWPFYKRKTEHMNRISQEKFLVLKCMELAGILRGKKRKRFMAELERRFAVGEIKSNEERIILAAERHSGGDRKTRRKYLRERLKYWESKTNHCVI